MQLETFAGFLEHMSEVQTLACNTDRLRTVETIVHLEELW